MAPLLEVIACSLADAVAAQKGGAARLELCRNLELGGLTPSFELVQEIKNAVDLPLRVMVRESVGFEMQDETEVVAVWRSVEKFAALGVDGVVLGYLKNGEVDVSLCQRIMTNAPDLKVTFHHAFENANDKFSAIRHIRMIRQVDRILSSGSSDALRERVSRLELYQRLAFPQMSIIAGGGIDLETIAALRRRTQIREFHVGRAARLNNRIDGEVSAKLVNQLVNMVNSVE